MENETVLDNSKLPGMEYHPFLFFYYNLSMHSKTHHSFQFKKTKTFGISIV